MKHLITVLVFASFLVVSMGCRSMGPPKKGGGGNKAANNANNDNANEEANRLRDQVDDIADDLRDQQDELQRRIRDELAQRNAPGAGVGQVPGAAVPEQPDGQQKPPDKPGTPPVTGKAPDDTAAPQTLSLRLKAILDQATHGGAEPLGSGRRPAAE